ncbi:HAMP domain-containing sensor histidine kinase [Salinarimonas ramus]|uniref:histidine kinase n=1 Tax=Salinarimonas ramus TaxID=690164 RepID=A0A917V2U6_9HYPH|nr:HAMP domain-containing sensor histidine kinase [Salinarimonas ramus]GGK26912.1 two-component sensor histidine kinase [Salinarimonas ramus]
MSARAGIGAGAAGLRKLLSTTAFRLSLVYLGIFALSIVLALGYVAWSAERIMTRGMVETIEAEIAELEQVWRRGGLRRLAGAVERRAQAPGASVYLFTTPQGQRITGNVVSVSPGTLDVPGERAIEYARLTAEDESGVAVHRALVRVFVLPGGFRLLVGRDMGERDRLVEAIWGAFGWSLLVLVVLGFLGGWLVSKRVLGRIEAMTATTKTIMAGDLSGRLGVSGSGDELDRLAQSLNAMLERIGELMEGMRQVSDNIAHDLKSPLARLRARADEALRTADSPDALRAALERTIEESDDLIRVFNALLMIARLEAGNAEAPLAEVDAAEIARGVGELYEAVAEEAGVPLELRIADALPLVGSRELLGQALANLIDNALKYASEAAPGAPVTLTAERVGENVVVSVRDRGPGIPADDRERVLERFVRLETARTRPGFGLGLSLVAAVARLHGGTLRLEDAEPGLRAVLVLPRARTRQKDPSTRIAVASSERLKRG